MRRRSAPMILLALISLLSIQAHPFELIAHRGGIPSQPENSMSAFAQASLHADAIETDVRFTRDHLPVILHDRTLDRTTNCRGLLSGKDWRQVRSCRLHTPSGRLSSQTIPPLARLLHHRGLHRTRLILEIKDNDPRGIDRLVEMIRGRKNICLSSFNLKTLSYLHRHHLFPELYLVSGTIPHYIPNYIRGIFLCAGQATSGHIQQLPKRLKIYLWTVNRPQDLNRCRTLPIEGVITDRVSYFRKRCTKYKR